ncbi:MAG: SDR family NAD(P)-dependent oxidoreductase [Clostridia bacterium]|nr:SDR family NAD(P)-dependent oxidoreductase [Clostridia bacterium]
MNEQVVAVTGASGGIGYAIAAAFAARGWRVYGLSRRDSAPPGVNHIPTDLTDEAAVKEAFSRIKAEAGQLHILINNAGNGISGSVEFTQINDMKAQFEVNFFAAATCVKYALPLLRDSHGKILNISSVAAVYPIPFQAFYSASKAALNALTLALRNETRAFQISVGGVMLGDAETGFTAARRKQELGDDIYRGAIRRSVAVMEKDEQKGMNPRLIGEKICALCLRRALPPLTTIGGSYKLLVFLGRLLPQRLIFFLIGKMYVKRP